MEPFFKPNVNEPSRTFTFDKLRVERVLTTLPFHVIFRTELGTTRVRGVDALRSPRISSVPDEMVAFRTS